MIAPFARIEQRTGVPTYPMDESLNPAAPQPPLPQSDRAAGGDGAGVGSTAPGGRPVAGSDPKPSGDVCRLLSLLADKTRMRILWLLADGERSVGSMTAELGLPQPTVSHHLAWLRTMQLVSPRRAGKNVFYALGGAAQSREDGVMLLKAADATVTIRPQDRR